MLAWQLEAGVDLCVDDMPVNRLMATSAPVAEVRPAAVAPPAAPALLGTDQDAAAIATAATTLGELEQALAGFEGCGLKKTAMNMVFGDGTPGHLMLIGEAPGADEDRQGKPFVGASGQLLDKMLAAAGFARARNAYISNVIFWRPPGNRKPTPAETGLCLPFTMRHIELAAPKAIMLLGATAVAALTDLSGGMTRIRGRKTLLKVADREVPVLPTYHPAYLLRNPAAKAQAWLDMLTVREMLA